MSGDPKLPAQWIPSASGWEVGASSPCPLASYLQYLNIKEKKEADAFSPLCLFDPYLEGIKHCSECNLKRYSNILCVPALTDVTDAVKYVALAVTEGLKKKNQEVVYL